MHIKEVEIDNFKSFAHKVTIPFLDGFTTISGPNGSGKSNIIDSILFGLGLSTSRTLRAEKLFHLISTHNKRNEASVKITFEDDDNSEQLVISRRIRKAPSGFVSSYTLNGKGSTLNEIHKSLDQYNISPNSYNVIMQGDVTTITKSSATERRKILDEIAGVADFDRRIDQATGELETVEQRVERSNIILTETETRLEQLEEERAQALKYQKLKDEKTALEGQVSTVKYFDIKNSIERLHESILDGNKARKNHEEELKDLNKTLDETREKLKEVQELVKAKGENEQIQIRQQAEGLKGSVARKKDAIEFINKKIAENKSASTNAVENTGKLKEKIEDAQLRIETKNDEIKILEANIKREKDELARILSEVSNINQSANENVEKRNQLRKQLESEQDKENDLIKTKLPLEEKLSRLKRDIEESQNKINELKLAKENADSKKDTLSLQVEELDKEMKEFERIQKTTMEELDKVKNEIQDSNYNIQLASRKIYQMEANKRAAEEANFGRAVDTIMSSGISGIHAPLAQLGQVDKEYSTALEIAMGGRMRFIVVDDDDVASVAIEVLKSSRAGRATFLPLNKIKQAPSHMKLPKDAGVVDFAINLIDFDEQYDAAFYHAVGDTLIVEDLSVARKLQGKYRMVTLDGSLIEKSGSMTGGSVGKSGLKFSQSEDEELKVFKERLKDLEDKHGQFESKKIDLESKLDKVRHEYSSIMNELNRKRIELENVDRTLNDSDVVIESKQKFIDENTPLIEEINQSLKELLTKESAIKASLEKISKEIEAVESAIPKDELSRLNELTETVEFEIKSNETKIGNCRNDINGINMEIDFNKQAIVAQQERVEKLKEDNINLAKEQEAYKAEIEQVNEKIAELNEKIKEIGSKLVELQQERDEINQKVLEQERIKNNLDSKIERIEEQIEAYKNRRKDLEPELYKIREELVNAGHNIASLVKPEISTEDLLRQISRIEKRMEELGLVNMRALVEYEEVLSKKNELQTKLETLSNERLQIIERMQGYEELKKKSFLETFNSVNANFVDIFSKLSDGTGKLILEKPEDPLDGGLTIEAQPRDKKMQRLESMSGGEKSLTALAFVFAIQRHLPAPFYAFDEVDMHLDGINVEKLSEMIKSQSSNTQFIVVSLRKPMIESANRTIGVTQKDSGVTKVTGVKLSE